MSQIDVLTEQVRVLQENQTKLFAFMELAISSLARIEEKLSNHKDAGCGLICSQQNKRIDELEESQKQLQKTIWQWSGGMSAAAFIASWLLKK